VATSATAPAQAGNPATGAQQLPPPEVNAENKSGAPAGSPPAAAQPTQPGEALPPPVTGGPSSAEEATTGTPNPTAVGTAPNPDEWRFGFHGYFRAPLRIGIGHRDNCAPGMPSTALNAYSAGCAAPGQSRMTFHSPYLPDDQYLSWTYDRQWEQAWTEMFFSYGNNHVVGTVGVQGYDLKDPLIFRAKSEG
jgi:hypothetical protein